MIGMLRKRRSPLAGRMPALQSENYVKSRKPRHIEKIGVSIWRSICYGEADIAQLKIEN